MAGKDQAQEPTEEPTQKRLDDARKKGDVARSRELDTAISMFAALCGLVFFGESGVEAYKKSTIAIFSTDRDRLLSDSVVLNSFYEAIITALMMLAPFMGLMFFVSLCSPMILGGFVASALKFDAKKWNPISGLKRVFGPQGFIELFKAILKVVLISAISIILFRTQITDYLNLGLMETRAAVREMFLLLFIMLLLAVVVLAIVAGIDGPIQIMQHKKKLRMTLQEIKEENKEVNGNPELKQKIRSQQMAVAGQRMMQDVPKADVIIVNPTHYSVALKYEEGSDAPKVVAKGIDHMALRIRIVGADAKVEIFSSPQLARAIYRHTEIGENIPSELYIAVAQILAYVFQLKSGTQVSNRDLRAPDNIEVPKSMRGDE